MLLNPARITAQNTYSGSYSIINLLTPGYESGSKINGIAKYNYIEKNESFVYPILIWNTYINSGAFILKINDETRQMYKDIIIFINNNPKFITHIHPFYDQPSISHYVFNNKDKFLIFDIEIFNTPIGSVIRHNWHKNKLMFDDLNKLLEILDNNNYERCNTYFDIEKNLDTNNYPNKINLESYSYLK